MNKPSSSLAEDKAWTVLVPKLAEFNEPQFHFGERVKWKEDPENSSHYTSGRIFGLYFDAPETWRYTICPDDSDVPLSLTADISLKLVEDSNSLRDQLRPQLEWQMTAAAAASLGISAQQLRKLHHTGLFKAGHHCRDTSKPGSSKSRWQWHIKRCEKALSIPPEQRDAPPST
ncbi:MAG: hypothetical protein AAF609_24060 [Cyanobacteria bacterium P01_C01_bin.120]